MSQKPTQLPKRPERHYFYFVTTRREFWVYIQSEADPIYDSQDAKIAELESALGLSRITTVACEHACRHLEKELRVMRSRLATIAALCTDTDYSDAEALLAISKLANGIEAARKEQNAK